MVALNPSLLRMSTPSEMGFDLHLPAGRRDVYLKRIAKIPEAKRGSWRFHVVRAGESLDSIASSLMGGPRRLTSQWPGCKRADRGGTMNWCSVAACRRGAAYAALHHARGATRW